MPSSWAEVGVGSLVLVADDPADGYFPAVILAMSDNPVIEERELTLRFRDFRTYPAQVRRLTEVGLLHTQSTSHLNDAAK